MEFIEIQPSGDLTQFRTIRNFLFYESAPPDDPVPEHLVSSYILMDNGMPYGRFTLYVNSELKYQESKTVCIGNYECFFDEKYYTALITKAMEEARKFGAVYLIGPMNGSTWENYRFATKRPKRSFFMEPSNNSYYNWQFKESGFQRIAAYYSAKDTLFQYHRPGIGAKEAELISKGYNFRNIDMGIYESELDKIYDISLLSFSGAFLYTPISRQHFKAKYLSFAKLIDPEFVMIAEDGNGEIAGFIFCVKDMYDKKGLTLVMKTIARKPGKSYAGIGEILGEKIYAKALAKGYTSIIHALMYGKGDSVNHSLRRTTKIINTYSLYAIRL